MFEDRQQLEAQLGTPMAARRTSDGADITLCWHRGRGEPWLVFDRDGDWTASPAIDDDADFMSGQTLVTGGVTTPGSTLELRADERVDRVIAGADGGWIAMLDQLPRCFDAQLRRLAADGTLLGERTLSYDIPRPRRRWRPLWLIPSGRGRYGRT